MANLEEMTLRGYRDAQEQCAQTEPDEPEGWGGFLSADDHSREILNCEPYSPEWETRHAASVHGTEHGAAQWVEIQLADPDAQAVEAAVRLESPETVTMPRGIMADWLEDRDDARARTLRHAVAPPDLG
ncbi:MAG: hypothetical protein FJ304_09085 [Planctomycetes bacterium]|nr:hypothetical protein [Planctomycetota bacterium]